MKRLLILIFVPLCFIFTSGQNIKTIDVTSVKIQAGVISGKTSDDQVVKIFKGIPFAAPPVGKLRWKEPLPVANWKGIKKCDTFGPNCIQLYSNPNDPTSPYTQELLISNAAPASEDCLYLNVWTAAKSNQEKRPVIVFIHGGGAVTGSGSITVYDGESMAKKGVVFVTINYRLGRLGYFAHPELTKESPHHVSGNYGLFDQVAALKWVKNNIAAFGGDPGLVTIAGQSAGAAAVRALTVCPLAKGLFQRAIAQSGSAYTSGPMEVTTALSDGEKEGVAYAKSKGVSTIAELRAMPAAEIVAVDLTIKPWPRFGNNIDGYSQTSDVMTVFAEGKQNDTPFLTGMNADEVRYMGEKNTDFGELYPSDSKENAIAVEKEAGQEQSRLNAYLWLEYRAKTSKTSGYVYYFDRAIPWPAHPEFGAFHTAEIPYAFNNLKTMDRPWTDVDIKVADEMSSYWVNFAKHGDPNGQGLPKWNAYTSEKAEAMRIGEKMGMIPVAASKEKFDFLKEQLLIKK